MGGVLADRAGGVGAPLAIGGALVVCCALAATSATLRGLEGAPEAAVPTEPAVPAMPAEPDREPVAER
ncbi:hypothetical protein [Microbispora triticiradicis]|uniref:hypothetical protein n=1 Tax=Microbispora triticiradicis TaxID=2200763 RepID=UPI001AD7B4DC|nr:hypothetical protein [Microbispora triticiradicis]MBO4270213.1 hypothetical protein [Microbispora triticiradicis]